MFLFALFLCYFVYFTCKKGFFWSFFTFFCKYVTFFFTFFVKYRLTAWIEELSGNIKIQDIALKFLGSVSTYFSKIR